MEKMVKIICDGCGTDFERVAREVKRNDKIGRKRYCNLKCVGKNNYDLSVHSRNTKGKKFPGARSDKYSIVREHFRRVQRRHHKYNITLNDLLDQWEIQNHKCPYTGVELEHPNYKDGIFDKNKKRDQMITASLDRIDSSNGYMKGNIQFISIIANHAKNSMSHDQMIEFCKTVAKFWQTKN